MTEQVEHKQDHHHTINEHYNQYHKASIIRLNSHDKRRLVFALPMLVVGSIALLFSYIYSSLILTFIGLGLVFWGSVLYYITSSRYYPDELFRVAVEAYSKGIINTLSTLGYTIGSRDARVMLFYPRQLRLGGLTQGYLFIYKDGVEPEGKMIKLTQYLERLDEDGKGNSIDIDIPARGTAAPITSIPADKQQGMIIKAPSQGLIDLFESRLDTNFALMSIDELSMSIERLFMEEFMLADSVDIKKDEEDDNTIRVTVKGRDTAKICSNMHDISIALCPICSTIALAISKSTGKAVMVKESSIGKRRVDTVYSLLEIV